MHAADILTQMGNQWREIETLKYPHTNGVCEVGYRRSKMSEEKKMDDADMLSADVKRVVAAMLCGFGIETKAGAAADNTAEAKERKEEEVSKKHGI